MNAAVPKTIGSDKFTMVVTINEIDVQYEKEVKSGSANPQISNTKFTIDNTTTKVVVTSGTPSTS